MFDEARAIYGTVKLCHKTQEELAKSLGVSQSFIANKVRLLKFSHFMQERIIESGISERHARAILRLEGEGLQYTALKEICDGSLSVAESEELVENMLSKKEKSEADSERLIREIKETIDEYAKKLLLLGVGVKREANESENRLYLSLLIENKSDKLRIKGMNPKELATTTDKANES
jgi:ParB family chromosome partitioning protein